MEGGGETMPTKAELEERNAVLQEALEEACDLIHGALGIEDADESEDDEG
jgi:hypothetical protein